VPEPQVTVGEWGKLGAYLVGAVLLGAPFAVWAAYTDLGLQAEVYRAVLRDREGGLAFGGLIVVVPFFIVQPLIALLFGWLTVCVTSDLQRRGFMSLRAGEWFAGIGYALAAVYIFGFAVERTWAIQRHAGIQKVEEIRQLARRWQEDCTGRNPQATASECAEQKRLLDQTRSEFDPRWWPDLRPEEERL